MPLWGTGQLLLRLRLRLLQLLRVLSLRKLLRVLLLELQLLLLRLSGSNCSA